MNIAIIGSRLCSKDVLFYITSLARSLVDTGHTVVTGGAEGADTAAILGAGSNTKVYEPWPNYYKGYLVPGARINKYDGMLFDDKVKAHELVRTLHPNPAALTQGAWKLHERNVYIVKASDCVIAFPVMAYNRPIGGTLMGILTAQTLNKPCLIQNASKITLTIPQVLDWLRSF